jgi:hypothetical protein
MRAGAPERIVTGDRSVGRARRAVAAVRDDG